MKNKIVPSLAVLGVLFALSLFVYARLGVSTGGTSNGSAVNSFASTRKIDTTVLAKASGGSITTARARAKFTSKKVSLGNSVVARNNIEGDENPTHVDAHSVFVGIATFIADEPGGTVPNFMVNLTLDGNLKCKTPNPLILDNNAVAAVGVDLLVDGNRLFAGTATQDATGSFRATGDLVGQFTLEPNVAKIENKPFPVNFGTLTDRQKLFVFFIGSTLVSFGADVPLSFAKADFYHTSSFKPVPAQGGTLKLTAAKKRVKVAYVTVVPSPPEYALYIESADTALINDIDSDSLRVAASTYGFFSSVPTVFNATAGPVADIDGDNIPDVRLTVDFPSPDTYLIASNKIIVFGVTNGGEPFSGTLIRTAP